MEHKASPFFNFIDSSKQLFIPNMAIKVIE